MSIFRRKYNCKELDKGQIDIRNLAHGARFWGCTINQNRTTQL